MLQNALFMHYIVQRFFLKKAPTKNQDGIVYNNNSLNLVVVTKALPQNVEKTLRICLILHNL